MILNEIYFNIWYCTCVYFMVIWVPEVDGFEATLLVEGDVERVLVELSHTPVLDVLLALELGQTLAPLGLKLVSISRVVNNNGTLQSEEVPSGTTYPNEASADRPHGVHMASTWVIL